MKMNSLRRIMCAAVLGILGFTSCTSFRSDEAMKQGFRLQDFLGRTWTNECVQFPLSPAQGRAAQSGKALVGPDGRTALYQIVPGATKKQPDRIAFLADLNPFETRVYQFTNTVNDAKSDLQVEETDEHIRLSNRLVGISIRKQITDGAGPVDGIRLTSGRWIGASRLNSPQAVSAYRAEVSVRGPVFAEVACHVTFATNRTWTLRFHMQANEPVVLVEETFSLEDDSTFELSPSPNFDATDLFYRTGKQPYGVASSWKIAAGDPDPVFVLEPWLRWWERNRQGQCFGLYNEKDADLLAFAAYRGDDWVDPSRLTQQSKPQVVLTKEAQGLRLTFPLKEGGRKWMILSLPKAASLAVLKEKNLVQTILPQKYLIKDGQFPLDVVKDYALDWPAPVAEHPRLFLRKADLPAFRSHFKVDPAKLAACIKNPVDSQLNGGHIAYYLATGDPALGQQLVTTAIGRIQGAVNMYLKQDWIPTLGFAPHHQTSLLTALNLTDAAMSGDVFTAEQIQRLRAQIAFLGYTVNRADYWSPDRGFGANPNMTTTVAAYQTAVACMIPTHPMAKTWFGRGMAELKDEELDTWSDANGGWLEAPHYAMVSYDYILGCFLMARNSGFADHVFDPKMKKIAEWFAKISTPPDARVGGRRHRPPIGNSYLGEPSSEFGTIAYVWKDRDPQFASEMQWMYQQQGSYPAPGIGGFFPTLAGYREVLLDPTIPVKPPAYKSELFPKTGVVLRTGFPSDRETMLYLIAGSNHAHYDYDSGSITIWGKGRIVADDFGYYGRAPADDHNMVESPAGRLGDMRVKEFETTDHLDTVRGVCNDWTRQIAFVKDADPLGPNYFVVCDTLAKPVPATWRLWLTADKVTVNSQQALVTGKEDVDTDIYFLLPKSIALKTEEKTRKSGSGLFPDGSWREKESTQTGLIAVEQGSRGFTAVIYPRLKSEKPAMFTSLADGKAVKVETAAGTDYVFLSADPFTFKEGDISFEGTSGSIQLRGDRTLLSLGAAGKIAAQGETLQPDKPSTKQ